jgi:hypothetical protein
MQELSRDWCCGGQLDPEFTALVKSGLNAALPAHPLNCPPNNGQAYPKAWIHFNAVQAFEHEPDALVVLGRDANAVVFDPESGRFASCLGANSNMRHGLRRDEQSRICHKLGQGESQSLRMSNDPRQRLDHLNPAGFGQKFCPRVCDRLVDDTSEIDCLQPQLGLAKPGVRSERLDKGVKRVSRGQDSADVILTPWRNLLAELFEQEFAIAAHRAQWRG